MNLHLIHTVMKAKQISGLNLLMLCIANYKNPHLNCLVIMNHNSLGGRVMWTKLALSIQYLCLEAQNIIHPGEQVWCLNPYEDVSVHEENPHGEDGKYRQRHRKRGTRRKTDKK